MNRLDWKPWHDVVTVRSELKTGELTLSTFAADLYDVVMGKARPVYQNPYDFFSFTYPTYNLRELAKDVMLRLAGKNEKAVRQLELTYGGGKTHTLITLYHLAKLPENVRELPTVQEFTQHIGIEPPRARIAILAFDKLDAEKGMEIVSPTGERRWLKQPWSVLAFQLAGSDGLRLLHPDDLDAERESAPAELLLEELLSLPAREGLATLILIDEVLMYVREKVGLDPTWRGRLNNFFQYLTQAATKVNSCAIVASLLATDPHKSDTLGKELTQELHAIFRREREEGVQPVLKEDAAEVLRRRFFTPESVSNTSAFRPHVQAALRGIAAVDEKTGKDMKAAEERFLKSYPFHPDLTDIFYSKWGEMEGFQRTRGVLRTFALALRDAETWDQSPLVSANVFLGEPEGSGLSESARELTNVAETEEYEGKRQAWSGILSGELEKARAIQKELPALRFREVEQAVFATFLHSQPIGQDASTRDLLLLLGHTRPDKIEMAKALQRWTELSWFLDEKTIQEKEIGPDGSQQLPKEWRLGSRPNLKQMHDDACSRIAPEAIEDRLLSEIGRCKSLTAGIPAGMHTAYLLPVHPRDIDDDGEFHFAILGPKAASLVGSPSAEARRFLEQKTGPDNERTNPNALILAVPSVDGLQAARSAIGDVLGWQDVEAHLKAEDVEGSRKQLLDAEKKKAQAHMVEMVRQAYCLVVTFATNKTVQAFRVVPTGDLLFPVIKNDRQSRIQETAVTSETLLPGGPYNLWREGETARPMSYLVGAFASDVRLPKMLNRQAIQSTLLAGCSEGIFVFRLPRPDRSYRTFWREQPDSTVLKDPTLEVVLPAFATLDLLSPALLAPGTLPMLWQGETLFLQDLYTYFTGRVLKVQKEGYVDDVPIPGAERTVINAAIQTAVKERHLWFIGGRASLLAEEIPDELLTEGASLQLPPRAIQASEILPENLPEAWASEITTAHAIADALSTKQGQILPWITVRETIETAFRVQWLEYTEDSGPWPCDYLAARLVKIRKKQEKAASSVYEGEKPAAKQPISEPPRPHTLTTEAALETLEIQDLSEQLPDLLKATVGLKLSFSVRVELEGSATEPITAETKARVNALLAEVSKKLKLP